MISPPEFAVRYAWAERTLKLVLKTIFAVIAIGEGILFIVQHAILHHAN